MEFTFVSEAIQRLALDDQNSLFAPGEEVRLEAAAASFGSLRYVFDLYNWERVVTIGGLPREQNPAALAERHFRAFIDLVLRKHHAMHESA